MIIITKIQVVLACGPGDVAANEGDNDDGAFIE